MIEHPPEFEVHQEEDLIATSKVTATAITGVLVGGAAVFVGGLIVALTAGGLRPNAAGPGGTQPAPREISHIEQTPVRDTEDGIELRERQRRELGRWAWVDRDAGIATIPIESAIDVVVAEEGR